MNARHSSETNEHYTPAWLVEAARSALGGTIDLDPASCNVANVTVHADAIFTRKENGYARPWHGTVFLNPPGGLCDAGGHLVLKSSKGAGPCSETGACGLPAGHRHADVGSSQSRWWGKLAREYRAGRVTAAIFVAFSVELLQTSQSFDGDLRPHAFPIWFPKRRVAYTREDGTVGASPPHSSMVVYLGRNVDTFVHAFDAGALDGAFLGPLAGGEA